MKTAVTLEAKEIRIMIAAFLGIPPEKVTPNRYNFSVEGITEKEIAERLAKAAENKAG